MRLEKLDARERDFPRSHGERKRPASKGHRDVRGSLAEPWIIRMRSIKANFLVRGRPPAAFRVRASFDRT